MLFPATGKEDSRKFPDRIYLKISSPELNPGLDDDRCVISLQTGKPAEHAYQPTYTVFAAPKTMVAQLDKKVNPN